jgi:hypothetical protein
MVGAVADPATPEQGDVLYWSGSAWVRLAHGVSGQALITKGNGANPEWGTPAGTRKLTFVFDGGGSALVGDSYVVDRLLWAFVANKTTVQVKPTGGTVTFEVFVDNFSTSSEPSTSVTNTNDPAISTGLAVEDSDISNWSDLSWAAGQQIKVRVKNNTPTATWASLTIEGTI